MSDPRTSPLRVLVVDDERLISVTLAAILRRAGFEAESAFSGEEGIAIAKRFLPDVLLTDFAMPGMNGMEAASEIIRFLPACRIVVLSAHDIESHFSKYAEKGYDFLLLAKPLHPKELLDRIVRSSSAEAGASDSLKILHVDDIETHRYSVSRVLLRAGFQVIPANNGAEAIAKAIENSPDLVLLDINLPDINGFEVCEEIKKNPETTHISIVHFTASSTTDESAARSSSVGADEFITEPISPSRLIARLRALMQVKYLDNTPAE